MDRWIWEWIVELVKICICDLLPRTAVLLVKKYWGHFRKSEATMSGRVKNNTSTTCLTCLRPFASLSRLREHIESEHEGTMKCSFCQVIIQTAGKRDSVRHLQKHKGEKINANTTNQLKEQPLIFCDQCHYTCQQLGTLKHHIKRVHSDEKHFTCSYINCNKSYAIIGDLRTHEATSHIRIKKFTACIPFQKSVISCKNKI